MSVVLALALQAAFTGRQAIGIYADWGAFRDASPARCFAIAEPLGRKRPTRPFASVATWPGAGLRHQLHVHLSRPRSGNAKVTLSIGQRRFDLLAGPADAWSPDAATDTAIVAAMRGGRSMSIETRGRDGRPVVDVYALQGAATAIDAAAVGCAKR
ncbi:hypothetical protein ASE86_14065 [Sphingomonas sp. Leaf33]|uniref:hypothetical protein n=1 Tax=Sphingomonas sp. Leaf33 TaxID=1736215 RepID=UPI0006FD293E|nr:hypothetical protein [Sphingomonas sp. Leaf33]KQN19575.1 hypothetical protein ASE86_14065 [Sphingomonas sp. Leaf33]